MLKKELQALLTPASVNFLESEHVYQHKVTGEFYKGCTTIADSMEKAFLAPWYAKEMANAILEAPYDAVIRMSPPPARLDFARDKIRWASLSHSANQLSKSPSLILPAAAIFLMIRAPP